MNQFWLKIVNVLGLKTHKASEQEKEIIDTLYKVEPKVEKIADIIQTGITETFISVKDEFGDSTHSEEEKTKKPTKVPRHWYNNGSNQKLVKEGEEGKLPENWVKGRLPKVPKTDKGSE